MARKVTKRSAPIGPVVRWSDGTTGVLTCARLDGTTLRLELSRGETAVSLAMERLAPDFYAGPWASWGMRPVRGSANAQVAEGVGDVRRLAGQWFQGAAVTTWVVDGVVMG